MTCTYPDLGTWGGRMPAEAEVDAVAQAIELAWSTVLTMTAGQLALCPITVRPVYNQFGWRLTWLTAPAGVWAGSTNEVNRFPDDAILYYNLFGERVDARRTLQLERPVGKVTKVTIDGVILDPSKYRLDQGVLVRQDGISWPTANDLTGPSGVAGVWEVTYFRGYPPGVSLIAATGILASEFYLSLTGGKKCRLPERVTAVTRQGVTYQMPADLFDDGRTGIREVDVVLRRYNPNGQRQPTVIASPDTVRLAPRVIG